MTTSSNSIDAVFHHQTRPQKQDQQVGQRLPFSQKALPRGAAKKPLMTHDRLRRSRGLPKTLNPASIRSGPFGEDPGEVHTHSQDEEDFVVGRLQAASAA